MKTKILTTALLLCFNLILTGQIVHVPADQPTIQDGINVATDGDTVLVDQGTYYENINFLGKAITVASHFLIDGNETHIENTIIDGSQPVNPDLGSVVTFESGEDTTSIIMGFTITGGTGSDFSSFQIIAGGGISVAYSGAKILHNVIEYNYINSPYHGIGAGISHGPPENEDYLIVRNNCIQNNSISADLESFGGGFSLSGHAIIENNIIVNNNCHSYSDRSGSGGVAVGGSTMRYLKMTNNTIANNSASSGTSSYESVVCGGLWIYKSYGIVSQNLIQGNVVLPTNQSWSPGVHIGFCNDDLIFERNEIIRNKTATGNGFGGGICIWQGNATLNYNLISGNTATKGGGIYISYSGPEIIQINHNTIVYDTATDSGGGVHIETGNAKINNSILWNNEATTGQQFHQVVGSIEMTYSNIQGSFIGIGNIDSDPLFANLTIGNYHLTANSPCIDAGDPNCMPDPDLTRCDMGRYYFHQGTLIEIPGHFATIQEGIEAATEGDTVLVAEGTYYENINFLGKPITVASQYLMDGDESHTNNTIIDGSQPENPDLGSVVTFSSGEDTSSVLCGFTITGGTGYYLPPGGGWPAIRAGGGIAIDMAGPKIMNNHILNNTAVIEEGMSDGAGISCGPPFTPYLLWLENNIIENNYSYSSYAPGAAGVSVFGPGMIINNTITNNLCESDVFQCGPGGLGCYYGDVTVMNNIITNNKAYSHQNTPTLLGGIGGGAIFLMSTGTVKDNIIEHNRVKAATGDTCFAGGVLVEMCTPDLLLDANTIANNGFDGNFCYGGGLAIWYGGATLHNNMIYGDSATYGGGICMFDTSVVVGEVEILNNTIADNYATIGGKGLFSHRTNATVMNTIFWNPDNPAVEEVMQEGGDLAITYSVVNEPFISGEGNFYEDPEFVDMFLSDYHLTQNSPCVNTGTDEEYPPFDFEGDVRPYLNTGIDIGADESPFITGVLDNKFIHSDFLCVYPNPVTSNTTVEYVVQENGNVRLSIFDITGKEVQNLIDKDSTKGNHTITWNAEGLNPGIYFIKLQTNGISTTRKLILLR